MESALPEPPKEGETLGAAAIAMKDVFLMCFCFISFGCISVLLGLRSLHVAWQVGVTLTFYHTVLDMMRGLSNVKNFGYVIAFPVQMLILLVLTALVGFLVYHMQQSKKPIRNLYLLAIWSCYGVACARSFLTKAYWDALTNEGTFSALVQVNPRMIFVHGTFTVTAIVTTWFILSRFSDAGAPEEEACAL